MPEIFLGAELFRTHLSAFFCPSPGAVLAARGGVARSHTSSMLPRAALPAASSRIPDPGKKDVCAETSGRGTRRTRRRCSVTYLKYDFQPRLLRSCPFVSVHVRSGRLFPVGRLHTRRQVPLTVVCGLMRGFSARFPRPAPHPGRACAPSGKSPSLFPRTPFAASARKRGCLQTLPLHSHGLRSPVAMRLPHSRPQCSGALGWLFDRQKANLARPLRALAGDPLATSGCE